MMHQASVNFLDFFYVFYANFTNHMLNNAINIINPFTKSVFQLQTLPPEVCLRETTEYSFFETDDNPAKFNRR